MGNLLDTSLFQELAEQEENEGQVVDGVTLSPGVEFIPEFHNTELDLDRDIPTPPVASPAVNSMFMSKPIIENDAFDKYCDDNPDFNAALNGHWEHI